MITNCTMLSSNQYKQVGDYVVIDNKLLLSIARMLSNDAAADISRDEIIGVVCDHFGVSVAKIRSKTRDCMSTARARLICAKILRDRLMISYPSIGRLLHRDHTTIMHSCRVVEREIDRYSGDLFSINKKIDSRQG